MVSPNRTTPSPTNDTAVTVSIGFATDTTTPKAWIAIDNIALTLTQQYCQASPTTPNP
jgi:hypothetical protein